MRDLVITCAFLISLLRCTFDSWFALSTVVRHGVHRRERRSRCEERPEKMVDLRARRVISVVVKMERDWGGGTNYIWECENFDSFFGGGGKWRERKVGQILEGNISPDRKSVV